MQPIDLATLVSSRLCHDVIGSVGAISTGLEIFETESDPAMQDQVMSLLADSATQARIKLTYYRMAFGMAASRNSRLRAGDVEEAVRDLTSLHKARLHFQCGQETLSWPDVKLLTNAVLALFDFLVRPRRITIDVASGGAHIAGEGLKGQFSDLELGILDGDYPQAIDPKSVPLVMAHLMSQEAGAQISAQNNQDGRISLHFSIQD